MVNRNIPMKSQRFTETIEVFTIYILTLLQKKYTVRR
jgi:hypothetical protein